MFGPKGRTFDDSKRARLEGVVPHLARAMKVSLELRDLRAADQILRMAGRAGRFFTARVDRDLHLVGPMSPENDDERSPLRVSGRHMTSGDPLVSEALRASVAGALVGASSQIPFDGPNDAWEILVAPSHGASGRCAEVLWWRVERAAFRLDQLPPSLRRIAALLGEGLSDKEIAERAEMSLATTRTYVARVLRRLRVKNRRELMRRR